MKKKILIVDDQVMYLKSLEIVLKKIYHTYTADSYESALACLKNEIDIALIDIRLDEDDKNNMDGLRILEWIKMNKPEVSAFVMSAYKEFIYAEKALNLGAKHFFKKPIDITSMKAILKEKA